LLNLIISSRILITPKPVTLLVYSGWSNDAPTKLCAARWYTSFGLDFANAPTIDLESKISDGINSTLSKMLR
jgi:hypothetical protein